MEKRAVPDWLKLQGVEAREQTLYWMRTYAHNFRALTAENKDNKTFEVFASAYEDLLAILDKPEVGDKDYEKVVEYLRRFEELYPDWGHHTWSHLRSLLELWLAGEGYGSYPDDLYMRLSPFVSPPFIHPPEDLPPRG